MKTEIVPSYNYTYKHFNGIQYLFSFMGNLDHLQEKVSNVIMELKYGKNDFFSIFRDAGAVQCVPDDWKLVEFEEGDKTSINVIVSPSNMDYMKQTASDQMDGMNRDICYIVTPDGMWVRCVREK